MFDKSTRTLIAMLFERSTVNEISGRLEDGRSWEVTIRRQNYFRDCVSYDGFISGAYSEDFQGDTLEETLDKMDAWFAEDKAIKEQLKKEGIA